jgi:hypothetical protein
MTAAWVKETTVDDTASVCRREARMKDMMATRSSQLAESGAAMRKQARRIM